MGKPVHACSVIFFFFSFLYFNVKTALPSSEFGKSKNDTVMLSWRLKKSCPGYTVEVMCTNGHFKNFQPSKAGCIIKMLFSLGSYDWLLTPTPTPPEKYGSVAVYRIWTGNIWARCNKTLISAEFLKKSKPFGPSYKKICPTHIFYYLSFTTIWIYISEYCLIIMYWVFQ